MSERKIGAWRSCPDVVLLVYLFFYMISFNWNDVDAESAAADSSANSVKKYRRYHQTPFRFLFLSHLGVY